MKKQVDRIFAVLYFLLGYGFIYTFSSAAFERNLAFFTLAYTGTVLFCLYANRRKPSRESWFWLLITLAIGIPYACWSVLYIFQAAALIAVAAYWTLCASGRLLEEQKTSRWVMFDEWNALAVIPFSNFFCQIRNLFANEEDEEKKGKAGAALLGIVLTIPVLVVILPLLSSADAGFEALLGNAAAFLEKHLFSLFLRIVFAVPVSFYLYGLIYGGITGKNADRISLQNLQKHEKSIKRIPGVTTDIVLGVMCLFYLLFIGIQATYLFSVFAGKIPENFTYAEYARRGFFELCGIGTWNLLILWAAEAFSQEEAAKKKLFSTLKILLCVVTLLLIATAVGKLGMYINVYGMTVNRIIPMVFLLWMAFVFFCVILRQKTSFPLVRRCVMAGAVCFCLLCVFPVERWAEAYNCFARMHGLIV